MRMKEGKRAIVVLPFYIEVRLLERFNENEARFPLSPCFIRKM